ncbi:MAG: Wzz/FepE/Etk N-terminal domain-containing protein [Capnocytophaga sp.]|uniref:Wzz/FepE/Etk N-terminal domain-containing protein n=1 Tax=Capnocytophaga sp. TaxID=44737 RepID=UPI003FA014B9
MENELIKEDEIDLLQLFYKVWAGRKLILLVTIVFLILGILVALFSAKEYTATTIMVPQTSDSKSGGGLGNLAALAGVNLGGGASETLPLTTYEKIIQSVPFKKRLVQTPLSFQDIPKKVTYEDYCKNYTKPSFLGSLMSFLLPPPPAEPAVTIGDDSIDITTLSREERGILNSIDGKLSLKLNEKEGFITLSCVMPEALPAAQMLQRAQQLLQEIVTEFKLQKAREEYDFVSQRCNEAEKDFKAKQYAVAQFQDRNRDLFSSLPQTRLQQMQAEYNLAFSVYTELAKQLETKRIKLKEDQPIFTIIEPVSVPNERSKPKRVMIVAIWTFVGLVIGIGSIFFRDFRRQLREKRTDDTQN